MVDSKFVGADIDRLKEMERRFRLAAEQVHEIGRAGNSTIDRLPMLWRGQVAEFFVSAWRGGHAPQVRAAAQALIQAADAIARNAEAQRIASEGQPSYVPYRPGRSQDTGYWGTPLNEAEMGGRHNSYIHGTVAEALAQGDTVIELDIHSWVPGTFDGTKPVDGDWDVRHTAVEGSHVESLSQGLSDIKQANPEKPTIVTLDVMDPLTGDHSSSVFDSILVESLGDERLYSPEDLMTWARNETGQDITTVSEAIELAGYPPADELRNRTMIVLTGDDATTYTGDQAFSSYKPLAGTGDPNALFYNVPEQEVSDAQIRAWQEEGKIVRTYPPGEVLGIPSPSLRKPWDSDGLRNPFGSDELKDLDSQNIDTYD